MDKIVEFFTSAPTLRVLMVCAALVLGLGIVLTWAARTRETIKLWPPEISAPESEELQACKTLQAALHDRMQDLANARAVASGASEGDRKSLDEETARMLEARKMDDDRSKQSGVTTQDNEQIVNDRITKLNTDIDYQNNLISWTNDTSSTEFSRVNSACQAIVERGR